MNYKNIRDIRIHMSLIPHLNNVLLSDIQKIIFEYSIDKTELNKEYNEITTFACDKFFIKDSDGYFMGFNSINPKQRCTVVSLNYSSKYSNKIIYVAKWY